MEVGKYWKRFKSCRTYKDKCSLQQEVWDADNMFRKLFSQQRDSWVVPELDNPYESLIPVFDHLNLFKCLKELPEEAAVPKVCQESFWALCWLDGMLIIIFTSPHQIQEEHLYYGLISLLPLMEY